MESINIREKLNSIYLGFRRVKVLGVFTGLLVLGIILSIATDKFFSVLNLIQVVRQSSFVGIMALGAVFVLSEGDVDLSVGGIYNVVGIITAFSLEHGLTVGAAIPIGLLTGIVCGLTNVSLSLLFGIPTLIITLGTMNIFQGLGLVISQARPIFEFPIDNFFFEVSGGTVWGLPFGVITLFTITAVLTYIYGFTKFGIHVRSIGGNLQVARAMGVKIAQIRIFSFMLNAALAAVASMLQVAFLRSADPSIGIGNELMVIASAIIGGTALSGGSGSVIGAMVGALLIAVIRNGIVLLGITAYWSSIVTGAIIIAAVAIDYVSRQVKRFEEAI